MLWGSAGRRERMTAKVHSEGEWGARQGVRQETADKAGGGMAAMVGVAWQTVRKKDGGG